MGWAALALFSFILFSICVSQSLDKIKNDVEVIKTVLIMKGILPPELVKKEK